MPGTRVQWDRIDEKTFNDLVEALLVREHTGDGLIAMAVDGRGGDGGIDVDVRVESTDQLVNIFQLKFFPEGFSKGFVGRREQIKRSLTQALNLAPPVWTLVVPRKVTVQERKAVRAMRQGQRVTIRFVTPTELNNLLSKHGDIERRFTADREVEILSAVHRPEAALKAPGDLASEVRRLGDRLDGRSEYWGTTFHLDSANRYTESYFAKRADAAQREPLGLSLTLDFAPEDDGLQQRLADALAFGTFERVLLPARVVRSVDMTGPEWFRRKLDDVDVAVGSDAGVHEPRPVRVDLFDAAGTRLARLGGYSSGLVGGHGGITLSTALEGGVTQTWTMPADRTQLGSLSTESSFLGATAHEIRRAIRFLRQLNQSVHIALFVDNEPFARVALDDQLEVVPDDAVVEFIEDLCVLEDHFDVALRLPPDGDSSDILWARVLRLLVTGNATAHPWGGAFGATLKGDSDTTLRTLLTDGSAILIAAKGFAVELFGTHLELGALTYYAHHARVDDSPTILRHLAEGTAAGKRISIRPVDGIPWVVYSAELLAASGRDVVLAQPWSLPTGEHPGYDRLPNRVQAPSAE